MIDWIVSKYPVDYLTAIHWMEARVLKILDGSATEIVWLLEHPPIYTAGRSAKSSELIQPVNFPIFPTGRGGRYTYHGPGQRVAYVMLDLKKYNKDVKLYVKNLEEWMIKTLADLNIQAKRSDKGIGVWVCNMKNASKQKRTAFKIGSIGVRVRKYITYHGISLNINPELENFNGIIPCGITESGVTSLYQLGIREKDITIDGLLRKNFEKIFTRKTIQKTAPHF